MKKDKKFVKKIAAYMTAALMAGGLIACGGSGEAASSEPASEETAAGDAGAALSGKISLAGELHGSQSRRYRYRGIYRIQFRY